MNNVMKNWKGEIQKGEEGGGEEKKRRKSEEKIDGRGEDGKENECKNINFLTV